MRPFITDTVCATASFLLTAVAVAAASPATALPIHGVRVEAAGHSVLVGSAARSVVPHGPSAPAAASNPVAGHR